MIRLRERAGGHVVAWVPTGFEVLASRVVGGRVKPTDLYVGADAFLTGDAGLAKCPDLKVEVIAP